MILGMEILNNLRGAESDFRGIESIFRFSYIKFYTLKIRKLLKGKTGKFEFLYTCLLYTSDAADEG